MKMINRTRSHQINRPVKWSEINFAVYVPILKKWEMELIKKRWTSLTALSVSILLCRNTQNINTASWLGKPSGFEPNSHSKGQNNTTRGKRCFWSCMTFILQRKWKAGLFFTKKKKSNPSIGSNTAALQASAASISQCLSRQITHTSNSLQRALPAQQRWDWLGLNMGWVYLCVFVSELFFLVNSVSKDLNYISELLQKVQKTIYLWKKNKICTHFLKYLHSCLFNSFCCPGKGNTLVFSGEMLSCNWRLTDTFKASTSNTLTATYN